MTAKFLQKSLLILMRRQTNILSAALIIMVTVILSQVLGLIRQRLLLAIFGASNTLGIYNYSSQLPDTIFQLTIAAALSSAFIPVFSEYITHGKEKEGHIMASTLLMIGLAVFSVISLIFGIFAPFFLQIFNLGGEFSNGQMMLMANLMRIMIVGQLLFIIGTFFTALLQSYNHFFVPGIAAAMYNLGIIIGILFFSSFIGIYAAPIGVIIGAFIYIAIQLPLASQIGFTFQPARSYLHSYGVLKIVRLMWPRAFSIGIVFVGMLIVSSLISYLESPGRMLVIYDIAKTLAFAPVALFGQTIAQAAFPVLSREKDRLEEFKATFATSFTQMLYLVLPIAVLILVLRIPVVRLAFGADNFDWQATVLTGKTLAFFSISIVAQALIALVSRGFYALHDTKTPLIIGAISTAFLVGTTSFFILVFEFGIESVAIAFSFTSICQLIMLFTMLDRKTGGFQKRTLFFSIGKILVATFFTGFALYIPIKLLDQLVFDTTRTVNLILLTGISSFAGLLLYVFLTWLFNVKEAMTFILLFKRIGNWREVLGRSDEIIENPQIR